MNKIEIIIAFLTMILTLFSFFLAIRKDIKGTSKLLSGEILANERRHSNHEKHLALLKERIDHFQHDILQKLNELNKTLR